MQGMKKPSAISGAVPVASASYIEDGKESVDGIEPVVGEAGEDDEEQAAEAKEEGAAEGEAAATAAAAEEEEDEGEGDED